MRSRSAPPQARALVDHFPLAIGNSWTYSLDGRIAVIDNRTIRVAARQEREGVAYYVLEGWPGAESALVRTTSRGRLVALDEETGAERMWYDFAAPVGSIWQPETADACVGPAEVASRSALAEVPAGSFQPALQITYKPSSCADAGLTEELFAPGVGLVQRTEITIAGPQVWRLTRAHVGGRTVEAPGLSFGIQIEQPVYTPNLFPPVEQGQEIPTLRVRVTLANRSSTPLSLTFPSPQLFDLEIRDEAGETLYFWSATRLFPAVITEVELSPGERVFEVEVPLSLQEQPYPPGRYVVEGWLTIPRGRLYSASVPFEVTEPAR